MSQVAIWTNETQLQEIKKIYAPDLTENEFQIFLNIGKATNLNPYLREIWAVKYGNQAASIFIGRDGYRKAAQANGNYDYHQTDAVYSKDTFGIKAGEIEHTYKLSDRGQLCGAYSIVKRKESTKPIYVYVEFAEYYSGHKDANGKIKSNKYGPMKPTLWDTKPATMIKKVAEAQALRMAFQDMFAGTYDEAEQWVEVAEVKENLRKTELLARVAKVVDVEGLKAIKADLPAAKLSEAELREVVGAMADKYGTFPIEVSNEPVQEDEHEPSAADVYEAFGPGDLAT